MEALAYLLAIVVLFWLLAGPPLLFALLGRMRRAESDLYELKQRVSRVDAFREREERARGEGATWEDATTSATATPRPEGASADPRAAAPASIEIAPTREAETTEAPAELVAAVESAAPRDDTDDATQPSTERDVPAALPGMPPGAKSWTPKPAAPRQPIEWERWIGVRGAALLGGVLFALAAVFLYLHAVEQQWITPRSRVIFGTVSGLVLIGASEVLRRRAFRFAPGAVAAAGIVALYASTWAANSLYALIADAWALAAFVSITAGCVGLAIRHASQAVAVLGLLGGFATPVVLAMPSRDPLGLFGYLMLLNIGMIVVGRRQQWSALASLGIVATAAIEFLWGLRHASPDELTVGLGSLAALTVAFIALRPRLPQDERPLAMIARMSTVLPPLALGVWFAANAEFEAPLWSLAIYGAVLQGGAIVLSRRQGDPSVSVLSAVALVTIVAAWQAGMSLEGALVTELCAVAAALGAGFVGIARFERTKASRWPALAILTGLLLVLFARVASTDLRTEEFPWPWVLAAVALGVTSLVTDRETGWWRCAPAPLAGTITAVALGAHFDPGSPTETVAKSALAAAVVCAVLLASAGALLARGRDRTRLASAWLAVVPLLATPAWDLGRVPGGWVPAALLAVAACLALLSALGRSGVAWGLTAILTSMSFAMCWAFQNFLKSIDPGNEPTATALAMPAIALAFLTAFPIALRARFERTAWAWRGSAIAIAMLYATSGMVLDAWMGASVRVFLPGSLAVALLALDVASARRITTDARRSARAWSLGLAAPFAATAALWWSGGQFEIGLIALIAAWLGAAAISLRHTGLIVWSVAALALGVLTYWIAGFDGAYRAGVPFLWNRFGFDALALSFAAAIGLRGALTARRTPREDDTRPWTVVLRAMPALFAVALALGIFQWIDISVFERWETGQKVRIRATHLPARDLTLSTSWIVYGLAWLGVGMWKRVQAARWCSLAILLVSLAKVFLFDLAHLEGLYRVASLFGLGLSLVVVSLLYQRFVFRDDGDARTQAEGTVPGAESSG